MTYARRELLPGDVLRAGKVYVGSSKTSKDFALFKKKKKKETEVKFLKCTDDTDREILINLNQSGTFYPISYTNGSVAGCVMQLTDILQKLHFPLDVKLVYGRIPNAPCSFSGMLRLNASFEEDTVVAATIMNYKNILLELSTQSLLSFKVAYATRQLLESKAYQQALEMCQERAEVYVRDMKVSFDFVTDTAPNLTLSEPDAFNTSGNAQLGEHTFGEPTLTVPRDLSRLSKTSYGTDTSDQDQYIDTSGSTILPPASQPADNSSDYEMIWLSTGQQVKKRSCREQRAGSAERRSIFRLSLEGTYLSCPIFSTDDRMKATTGESQCGQPDTVTSSSGPPVCKVEPLETEPPPLPPRVPRPKSSVNGMVQTETQNIYEVLHRTQPVEKALQFQEPAGSHIGSVASVSSTGSDLSSRDRTNPDTSTNYENSSSNVSFGDSTVDISDLDEDLRDYDFPEPYLLRKPSDSDYSPVDEPPSCPQGSLPPADVVSYYDSGSYRPVSPGDYLDDLPLGASSSQIGGFCPQSGTSGHTACNTSSGKDKSYSVGSCLADAAGDESGLKAASGLTVLTVSDVADSLRRLGLKDAVIDSFVSENIDGDLLSKFDEASLQDTFPSLRSIELRKICLFIQSGWQPNI
ncbi:uncharacterized protein LOC135471177 isoform X2 [Liolophura sinensis]